MKKITLLLALLFTFNLASSQTIFEWETAVNNFDDTIDETVEGIKATFSGSGIYIDNYGGWGGSTDNLIGSGDITSVTFTFDQAVDVNSILPIEINEVVSVTYRFTPTGGSNSPVDVTLVNGFASGQVPIDLNWTNVTSFTVTVTSSPNTAGFVFDKLSVSAITLSMVDNDIAQKTKIYPNPVKEILYIKNVLDLKSIDLYNNLGQLILQFKQESIDVSHLSKGLYFLQINTKAGIETKRIIKK